VTILCVKCVCMLQRAVTMQELRNAMRENSIAASEVLFNAGDIGFEMYCPSPPPEQPACRGLAHICAGTRPRLRQGRSLCATAVLRPIPSAAPQGVPHCVPHQVQP
jgi:hypothetical protein